MAEFPGTRSSLLADMRSSGDVEAWEQFVLLYRPAIYRMARRRGMQDADALDVVQTVLTRVAGSISRWEKRKPEDRFRHWLRRVARTGRPPFRAPTTLGVMRQICEDAPTPILELNPDIPEWLASIIERLMAKQIDDRFGSAREVQTLLESCLSHVQQPTVVKLPRVSSIGDRPTRVVNRWLSRLRTRTGVRVMAVISILSVVAVGVLIVRGDGSSLNEAGRKAAPTSTEASGRIGQAEQWSLGHGYSRRGNHIEFKGERIDQAGRETLGGFEKSLGRRLVLARNVDAASFVALSEEYAKDKDTVYYKWISPGRFWVVEIPNADPATFEALDFNLARDAKRVWRTDVPIEGVDAATAQVVNPGWVWKDRRSVYYQFTPLVGVDPGTFRHLNQAFYRDANHVYWSTTRLEGADVNTFRTFGNDVPYAADKRHVWFGESRIPHVDAASFRFIHNHVIADNNGVYVSGRGVPVIGADADSFQKVAELASADSVLLRDSRCAYLFDPHYVEVYTLTPSRGAVEVTKPVWFGEAVGPVRHAATVSATWKDGALSEPCVTMRRGFENSPKPTWEVGKMQRMIDALREAVSLLPDEPVPATTGEARPLRQRGEQ